MKSIILAAAATALLAGPALAQTSEAPHNRAQGTGVHSGGTNQQSGGPRDNMAPGGATGGGMMSGPATTGTVAPASPGAAADPLTRTQGNETRGGSGTPSFQQGDNQQAGGPANELNTQTGLPNRR